MATTHYNMETLMLRTAACDELTNFEENFGNTIHEECRMRRWTIVLIYKPASINQIRETIIKPIETRLSII